MATTTTTTNTPKPTPKPKRRTATKPRVRRGGGKALPDFTDGQKIKVTKKAEISRGDAFRTGQTVAQNLVAQKKAGFRGRRKYLRRQIAAKRVTLQ